MSQTTAAAKAGTPGRGTSGNGKARGPYAKTAQTRATIVKAAFEVFAQAGYQAGSIRQVAEKVGLSEAGVLHHFPSKTALLQAVLAYRDDQSYREFPLQFTADPRQTLQGFVRLISYNTSVPGIVELFCRLSAEATVPSHPAHQYFKDRYAQIRVTSIAIFNVIAERGQLVPPNTPESAAAGVVAMMDGLQVQWLLDRTSVDMAVEVHRYLSSLVTFDI
ncbi:MAG: TetR/AcrR family transcriptional regulator [Bifidobacteriaceae bacterium]|jgi:AcrR family transcriptional regulator|nr:TetR/AcrR family transcriptional regulator [Bifidobacteriaceae bacterium]